MRAWKRGEILAAGVTGETLFPMKLHLRCPEGKAVGQRFDDVRRWIHGLEESSRPHKGFGYEIAWIEINHRQLGRNRMPEGASILTESDALRFIGMESEGRRFKALAEITIGKFPALAQWVSRRPFKLLENEEDWPRVLDALAWFRDHPRSNLYLRQVDIPGVDTKFIESRLQLFSELLDLILDPYDGRLSGTTTQKFNQRCGLRNKPSAIRFRVLDSRIALAGLCDLTIPANDFAALNIAARHVFITENEVNGLAFPDFPGAIVIFGLGYSVDLLQSATWMADAQIFYWGDIDTHGFAMLDRLRIAFPHARSLLMDRETLLAHQPLWVQEQTPSHAILCRLGPDEQALFDDLVHDRLGNNVRLEQERVSYAFLEKSLKTVIVHP